MNKFLMKIRRNRKGFSLVEMLVAMAIFMIFTGLMINSYISIVKSLRGAEEYRILYANARHVFDTITENARNSTIYPKNIDKIGVNDCNMGMGDYNEYNSDNGFGVQGNITSLAFCAKDGLSVVGFKYDENLHSVVMQKVERQDTYTNFVFADENRTSLIADKSVTITGFRFYVWPLKNPFDSNTFSDTNNLANLFQPKVTIVATFERKNSGGGTYTFNLQTSVSLRTYN